jgi:hypothetical protein
MVSTAARTRVRWTARVIVGLVGLMLLASALFSAGNVENAKASTPAPTGKTCYRRSHSYQYEAPLTRDVKWKWTGIADWCVSAGKFVSHSFQWEHWVQSGSGWKFVKAYPMVTNYDANWGGPPGYPIWYARRTARYCIPVPLTGICTFDTEPFVWLRVTAYGGFMAGHG